MQNRLDGIDSRRPLMHTGGGSMLCLA